MSDLLHELRSRMLREEIPVKVRVDRKDGFSMNDYSILRPALHSLGVTDGYPAVDELVRSSLGYDRAVGALVCLVVGDSIGHPLEFVDAVSDLPPYTCKKGGRYSFLHTALDPVTGNISYTYPLNQFSLQPGQWTDDASMALCVADSLLVCGSYVGGDCRARFHNWWNHGYNNAFRLDAMRKSSVGLGGNISKSIDDLFVYDGMRGKQIPAVFRPDGEDAGNGSIMRLAPVPIRFSHNVELGEAVAELHSFGTHPGPDAAQCCRFITYFVARAIHRIDPVTVTMKHFLDRTIEEYLATRKPTEKMAAVLRSTAPTAREACWDWKKERLGIEETLHARGRRYNGHPVSADYFGAYCMDGLAMALWGMYSSTSAAEGLVRVVNLCGDADTTGAISGQMLGAFYGYSNLVADPMGAQMIANMKKWDPEGEIPLRAALLFDDGKRAGPEEPNLMHYVAPPRPPSPEEDETYWGGPPRTVGGIVVPAVVTSDAGTDPSPPVPL